MFGTSVLDSRYRYRWPKSTLTRSWLALRSISLCQRKHGKIREIARTTAKELAAALAAEREADVLHAGESHQKPDERRVRVNPAQIDEFGGHVLATHLARNRHFR